jgi:hypothetical protein
MSTDRREILEVLDCDIGVRPKAAPGMPELLPHVRGVSRRDGALLVEFDAAGADALEGFVAAERLCCAGIAWEIEREPGLRLRVTAAEAQLVALEDIWRSSDIEQVQ